MNGSDRTIDHRLIALSFCCSRSSTFPNIYIMLFRLLILSLLLSDNSIWSDARMCAFCYTQTVTSDHFQMSFAQVFVCEQLSSIESFRSRLMLCVSHHAVYPILAVLFASHCKQIKMEWMKLLWEIWTRHRYRAHTHCRHRAFKSVNDEHNAQWIQTSSVI